MNFLGELFAMLEFLGIDTGALMEEAVKSTKTITTRTKHKCRKHGMVKHVYVTKTIYD